MKWKAEQQKLAKKNKIEKEVEVYESPKKQELEVLDVTSNIETQATSPPLSPTSASPDPFSSSSSSPTHSPSLQDSGNQDISESVTDNELYVYLSLS